MQGWWWTEFVECNKRLIADERAEFRSREGYVDKIFTLKKLHKKAREKKQRVCDFVNLEKAYDIVNRAVL